VSKIYVKMVERGKTRPHFHYAISSPNFYLAFFVKANLGPDEENWIELGNPEQKYLVLICQDARGAWILVHSVQQAGENPLKPSGSEALLSKINISRSDKWRCWRCTLGPRAPICHNEIL